MFMPVTCSGSSRMMTIRPTPSVVRVVATKASQKATPAPAAKPADKTPKAPAKPAAEKPKAKRATSAYTLFCKAAFKDFKQEGDDAPSVMKKLAVAWKALPADKRKPFDDEAAKERAVINKEKEAEKAAKKADAKPLSSYMQFCAKARADVVKANPGKSAPEIGSLLGAAWKQLPESEKAKYKAKYEAEMAEWKQKHPQK